MWKDELIKIFEYFGYEKQRRKLVEEVNELNDEILLFEEGIGDIKKIREELADAFILLNQFKRYYEIEDEELLMVTRAKINRTLDRIESGYYAVNTK